MKKQLFTSGSQSSSVCVFHLILSFSLHPYIYDTASHCQPPVDLYSVCVLEQTERTRSAIMPMMANIGLIWVVHPCSSDKHWSTNVNGSNLYCPIPPQDDRQTCSRRWHPSILIKHSVRSPVPTQSEKSQRKCRSLSTNPLNLYLLCIMFQLKIGWFWFHRSWKFWNGKLLYYGFACMHIGWMGPVADLLIVVRILLIFRSSVTCFWCFL